jgi:DNA-binding transcriptional regulator YiaG
LRILQSKAARLLGVCTATLSRWEWDTTYPAREFHPRVVDYLGYDPFISLEPGRPKGNESAGVANLTRETAESFGLWLRKRRTALRKSQKEFAKCLGVDARTLRSWEVNNYIPIPIKKEEILRLTRNLVTARSRNSGQSIKG